MVQLHVLWMSDEEKALRASRGALNLKPAREMTDEELASIECTCDELGSVDCPKTLAERIRVERRTLFGLPQVILDAEGRLDAALAKERA